MGTQARRLNAAREARVTAVATQLPEQHINAAMMGAECWRCPLLDCGRGPVPPTIPENAEFFVVAEAPGANEVEHGRTLIGASGRELRQAITNAGLDSNAVAYTNTIMCLDGSAQVRLAGGSTRSIREIVRDRDPGPVRTMRNGVLSAAPITDWFRNHRAEREMRHLRFEHSRSTTNGPSAIRATFDHPVLTRHGWVPVADLGGEEIATGQRALEGAGRAVVLGTLLGDAGLRESRLTIVHAADQETYARLKAQALSQLGSTVQRQPPARNNTQDRVTVAVRASRWLAYLEKAFYPEGKKRLGPTARRLLVEAFDPLLLAVWFCDDGYTNIRPGRKPYAEIATNCFDHDDVAFLQERLRALGIATHVRDHVGPRIVVKTEAAEVLLSKIAEYVPPDLAYKLPEHLRSRFRADAYAPSPAVTFWDRAVVQPIEARSDTVYCIDVDETHNFVTTGGVVHNCQPEGGDLKRYLSVVKKQGLDSPIECCKPRLDNDLARAKFVLLMGGASLSGVGVGSSVMKVRGTPITLPSGVPALATPHAAFVMRDEGRTFRPIFHADIAKAVRLYRSGSTWKDPWYFVPRTAVEVENFLAVERPRVAVDVETDGKDAWSCNLRRIGIGTDKEVMIYSPLSVRGHYLLSGDEIRAQTSAIAAYFRRAPRMGLHNGIAFDSIVLWRHGMPLADDHCADTMVGHQIGFTSELPHSLDFLGSMYTDAPHWKDSFKHSTVKDDAILDKYLSFDIAVTFQSEPFVEQNLIAAQQGHIYTEDAELFRIGRSMSALGIYIDPVARWNFALEYQEKADRLHREFLEICGRDVNPNSPKQVQKLLYHDLGLPALEDHQTESGEMSTDESTLLDLLALGVDARARKIIQGILGCREADKILGTYTGYPQPNGTLVGGPRVHADGRMRGTWRPGKRSGRWGSNDPNMQNIPKKLRAMFKPYPGNVFVAADMSAVELRMIAWLANDEPLIEAFKAFDEGRGPDVHIYNACQTFGCKPEDVDGKIRDFIKRFVYALSYDAEPPRIYQTLSLLRDDNLNPLFPDITLQAVERLFALWWKLHPAVPSWKKNLIHGWRATHYIATKLGGRKRFFIGGERAPEMGNHDVQGSSAKMQNDAIITLTKSYPFDFNNHRGLIVNGHDQTVTECAKHEAEDVKRLVGQVMCRTMGRMNFPAVPHAGDDWKAVS